MMKFIIVFLVGMLVLVFTMLLSLLKKRLVIIYPRWRNRINLLVSIDFIIWITFIFWAFDQLFREEFYFHYLIIASIFIVAGFLSWFLLSDIFAGIVFKMKHNLKTGTHISTGDLSGKITSQRLTYIMLKTEDGRVLRIPYSRINHAVISEMTQSGALREHSILLEIKNKISKAEAESLIHNVILNSPWSNLNEDPSIKFLKEEESSYFFEIMLFSTSLKQMKFIEMALEKISSAHVVQYK